VSVHVNSYNNNNNNNNNNIKQAHLETERPLEPTGSCLPPFQCIAAPIIVSERVNNSNNKHAYAGQQTSFTHLRALFGTH
jgi:hypothetical protein